MSPVTAEPRTIVQTAKQLREKIGQVRSRAGNEQILQMWKPIQDTLPRHRERMETLLTATRNLRRQNVISETQLLVPRDFEESVLAKLEKFRVRLTTKPSKVMEGNTWANCNTALAGAAIDLEATLKRIWSNYIQLLLPNVENLRPFVNLGRCAADMQKITRLEGELNALKESLPTNESKFVEAEHKSREIKGLVAKLELGDIPAAVKKFVEKVNSLQGATLVDLDDHVFSWLREKSLLGAFRIK